MSALVALLDGRVAGTAQQAGARLSFQYEESWRGARGAYPLSLSLPLAQSEHSHAPLNAFLWGLLPDNELVLDRWARRFQVSARNSFALIGNVGEDCAGAVQFVSPARLNDLTAEPNDNVEWLAEAAIGDRLRALQVDASAWRMPRDTGQFSLAGAQPKTALHFDGRRWGIPSGRTPTTYILKPPTGDLDGHVENEHLCLALAKALGLPAASSDVRTFDGVSAIVVERYDRMRVPPLSAQAAERAGVRRVHQEDLCQALGKLPGAKYQNDGGPSPAEIVALLRAAAFGEAGAAPEEDVRTFVQALIFNWLIGGTDAHAKNYSLLIGTGAIRLAPLYDLASVLPYPDVDPARAKLAMKIGGEYELLRIGASNWTRLAAEVRLDADVVLHWVREMSAALPDQVSTVVDRARAEGLRHPIVARLATALTSRAQTTTRLVLGQRHPQ